MAGEYAKRIRSMRSGEAIVALWEQQTRLTLPGYERALMVNYIEAALKEVYELAQQETFNMARLLAQKEGKKP
jgi:hypothetical protein